jgi:hypothetical protein
LCVQSQAAGISVLFGFLRLGILAFEVGKRYVQPFTAIRIRKPLSGILWNRLVDCPLTAGTPFHSWNVYDCLVEMTLADPGILTYEALTDERRALVQHAELVLVHLAAIRLKPTAYMSSS